MFSIISLEEEGRWRKIVEEFKAKDIYYFPEYTKAFKVHGDGEPLLIYYKGENLKAINVVMKRDIAEHPQFSGIIPKGRFLDLSTPYGYGGFIMEGDISKENITSLSEEYSELGSKASFVSEFVRFHPLLENHKGLEDIYEVLELGGTISLDLSSEDAIISNMTSQSRNKIRKAKTYGVEVFWGRSRELLRKLKSLYKETMDKNKADDYYYFQPSFFDSILQDLKYNFLVFYSVFEGNIIAMCIVLFSNGQMHYHICGADKEYLQFAPTNLLIYEAALWGARNGYKSLHLGGGVGSKADSLYRFKKGFNKTHDNTFVIGKKIFNEESYQELMDIRRKQGNSPEDSSFFPKYRA